MSGSELTGPRCRPFFFAGLTVDQLVQLIAGHYIFLRIRLRYPPIRAIVSHVAGQEH